MTLRQGFELRMCVVPQGLPDQSPSAKVTDPQEPPTKSFNCEATESNPKALHPNPPKKKTSNPSTLNCEPPNTRTSARYTRKPQTHQNHARPTRTTCQTHGNPSWQT